MDTVYTSPVRPRLVRMSLSLKAKAAARRCLPFGSYGFEDRLQLTCERVRVWADYAAQRCAILPYPPERRSAVGIA